MNTYELREVTATRGGTPVVAVPELVVARGEIAALTGPNGAGKTTLLHLLGFLEPPLGQCMSFSGTPVSGGRLTHLRRRVGLLLQQPYLFDTTVYRNVEWGLKLRRTPGPERRKRVFAELDRVGLADYCSRAARRLSGGEAQRVALARLMALCPEVLLLDEPATHLDAESARTIERVILEENRTRGTTVVLAIHDLAQAYRLGASIWTIGSGVLTHGQPENVFRGRPLSGEPGVFDTGRVRLFVSPLSADARCVAVHPSEIVLSRETLISSARNHLEGIVTRAEIANGDVVRVTLDAGEAVEVLLTRRSWEEMGLNVGTRAVASFKATAARAY